MAGNKDILGTLPVDSIKIQIWSTAFIQLWKIVKLQCHVVIKQANARLSYLVETLGKK